MKLETKNNINKENVESTKGYMYENPDSDIYESDNEYKIVFDIPGVEKDEINLKVEKNVLSLTAECSKEPVDKYECLRHEMNYAGYKRSFELGNSVDSQKINALYNNGTLSLNLPKKEDEKAKEINIKIN